MSTTYTDLIQTICSILSVGIAIWGFILIYIQIKQLKKSIHGDTHCKLYTEEFDCLKIFLEYPYFRPYFYDNKNITTEELQKIHDCNKLNEDLENIHGRVQTIAELFITHFEHVILQLENLPDHIKPSWTAYIKKMYSTSPILKKHLLKNKKWYSKKLYKYLTK